MTEAIKIIQREHRALAAVVHCLEHVTKDVHDHKIDVDPQVFEAIIEYVETFPDKLHHPKEDEYLYAALTKRDPGARKLVHDLQEEHRAGERKIADLKWKLQDWKDGKAGFEPFYEAALAYVDFQRRHIGLEEQKAIPAARNHLTENDWREINAAFADNDDPIFGDKPKAAFDALFHKIVEKAPAPYGLAERKEHKEPEPEKMRQPAFRRELMNLNWI
jgi:branched-chain amino acid transport system ATP-binding protein